MHEIEEIIRLHAVLGHHSPHRRSIAPVIILLQPEGLRLCDLEEARDVISDALVHLLPEIDVVWIKRVVEIEYPGLGMREATGKLGWHSAESCEPREALTASSTCRRRDR